MNINEQIFQEFKRGNIEPLYMALYPSLHRYAERILEDRLAHEAEDCIQEAFYKVFLNRKTFNSTLHLRTFIFTCVHNEIVSIIRKNQTHAKYISRLHDNIEDKLFDDLVMQETLERLYMAIEKLPSYLREIFDLSFEQGLQNKEIADMLHLTPAAIKKRKAKLISTLREQFHDDTAGTMLILFLSLG